MERIRSLREQIISFERSSYLGRDEIEENNCLIQWSPFDVRKFFSVRVRHCISLAPTNTVYMYSAPIMVWTIKLENRQLYFE